MGFIRYEDNGLLRKGYSVQSDCIEQLKFAQFVDQITLIYSAVTRIKRVDC